MQQRSKYSFTEGLRDGVPIGLGYLSVAFTIGLMAVRQGLSVAVAVVISATNLTSAGQVAGLAVIAAMGSMSEMALTQLVINLRYALMSISLSQKLDSAFSTPKRMLAAFGMTDEIFAVAASKEGCIGARYMYGLILIPFLGWTLGTLAGAVAGDFMPASVKAAMGIAIYGMFIAIVLPPATKSKSIAICAAMAAAASCLMHYLPVLSGISDGFGVILCAVAAAGIAAVFWPLREVPA